MNIMKQTNKNILRYGLVCLLLCLLPVCGFAQEIITDIDFGCLPVEGYEANPYTMPVKPSRNVARAHLSLRENAKVRITSYPEKGFSGIVKIYEHEGEKREIFVESGNGSYLEGTTCLMAGSYDISILCTYTGLSADVYKFLLMIWTYKLKPGEYPYEPIGGEDTEKEPSYGYEPIAGITSSRSYLREQNMITDDGLQSLETISYFDGMGRPVQTVLRDFTPFKSDFVDFTDYNSRGLVWRQWLPVSVNGKNGAFVNNLPLKAGNIASDVIPYSKTVYERISLDRPAYTCGAGESFRKKRSGVDYLYNRTDSLTCMKYGIYNDKLAQYGYYPQGTLEVKRYTDEDSNVNYVFADRMGRVILERMMNGDIPYDTYYVYTPGGDLRYVLPPMMDGNLSDYYVERYAYQYCYDGLHRLTEKKLPGCEPICYVYDNADRVAFQQDGNLRAEGKWAFTITDLFDREVVSGLCNHIGSPTNTAVKAIFDATGGTAGTGYAFEGISVPSLLCIKYYDTYDYLYLPSVELHIDSLSYVTMEGYGKRYETTPSAISTKGRLTGTRVFSPETGEEIITAYYYDDKGNVIQQLSTNSLQGYDREFFSYTFTGKILRKLHCHSTADGSVLSELYDYVYDHAERMLSVTHRLDNGPAVTLLENSYDSFCRLQSRVFHNGTTKQGYTYNIRGWMTGISSDKFSQSLHYTDGEGIPRYNGNISSMEWKAASDSLLRGYCFDYDGVNRLTTAVYGEGDGLGVNAGRFNEQVTRYDKQGNIWGLMRSGQISETEYGVIDHLVLSYDGNLLQSVSDDASASVYDNGFEFKDGTNSEVEYFYDANGNLTKDLNKKITDIQYNCLNLPSRIQFEDDNSISYVYDANGTKLRTTHLINGVTVTTDYCGNVIYENGVPKLLLTECGYITLSDTVYHYFLQDHQGNNRVIVDENGTVEEVNHYYPFGGLMASSSSSVQPYKYNGKELDRERGLDWYDYGVRHYDAALGRWHVVDPMTEKYYSINPYAYCGNEPIGRIDPDGADWRVQTHYNEETKKIEYQITVNAVLYNNSNMRNVDMQKLATNIIEQINSTYSINDNAFVSKMNFKLRVVNSVDEINDSDHILQIVNQRDFRSTGSKENKIAADSYPSGLGIRLGTNLIADMQQGVNGRTVAHELGHTGGLGHLNEDPLDRNNLMMQAYFVHIFKGNYNKATQLNHVQIKMIRDNYIHKRLHQGSPLRRNWWGKKQLR